MTRPAEHDPSGSGGARSRDRTATEERLIAAVGELLARDGFAALGVNTIAKQAGVDKVLIYRYFGGLPELLRAWGASGRFWPRVADLIEADPTLLQQPLAERYARFFEHFIDELRARPMTLEILAAEIADQPALARVLDDEREAWGAEATRVIGGAELQTADQGHGHLRAITLLLVIGAQYLLVRSRSTRIFNGIDVQSHAGWAEIKAALRTLAFQLLGGR